MIIKYRSEDLDNVELIVCEHDGKQKDLFRDPWEGTEIEDIILNHFLPGGSEEWSVELLPNDPEWEAQIIIETENKSETLISELVECGEKMFYRYGENFDDNKKIPQPQSNLDYNGNTEELIAKMEKFGWHVNPSLAKEKQESCKTLYTLMVYFYFDKDNNSGKARITRAETDKTSRN